MPSNNPIEDRRAEAQCLMTTGMLFGTFDGHGGAACAEVVSRRLFTYIAASLLPLEMLRDLEQELNKGEDVKLLQWFNLSDNEEDSLSPELRKLYRQSFTKFVLQLIHRRSTKAEFQMRDNLAEVFEYLDRDLWAEVEQAEAVSKMGTPDLLHQTLAVAMSGAVACVAHIDDVHLHLALTGDCSAVIGMKSESNAWVAKELLKVHSYDNEDEVARVVREHPKNESETVLQQERLLGQLAPLRAFGDFRYKWPLSMQKRLLLPLFGHQVLPPNYYTPPYLTARPEVIHHRLLPRDKFLVIASDGLWEQLPPSRVVQLVGEYMHGRQTLEPFRVPATGRHQRSFTLGDISKILARRKEGIHHKPIDSNAATHLLRSTLGGTEYGIDHAVLSQMLSVPEDVVRLVRDDITITIVFFDTNYLRHCPV